ncbi:YbjN domain-containing protein [Phenylobacterium sp. 20VBR1]|uniref:YbjN domain-containing protein n=1 Tax=Phenylobacterium glaciei TaxID=2803784 RepID=A0A941CYT6_9CAUL|nr:YbjN domain-containing protein [Phenylobacterium glaciei]MBR7619131.1 YbjN domain-containing protein [Phenylobacterium glaciei]
MTGKRIATLAAAILLAALPAARASARDLPAGGLTRAEIAQWLQGHGYKAKIHDDSSGTSIVTSASDGLNWDIYVYECNGAGRCPDLQYAAGWSGVTVADDTLNTWNRDNRYIRAYQGEKGSVWGEFDVDISPGGTWEQLDKTLDRWTGALPLFAKHIGQ